MSATPTQLPRPARRWYPGLAVADAAAGSGCGFNRRWVPVEQSFGYVELPDGDVKPGGEVGKFGGGVRGFEFAESCGICGTCRFGTGSGLHRCRRPGLRLPG